MFAPQSYLLLTKAKGLCRVIVAGARLEARCDDSSLGLPANGRLPRVRLDRSRVRLVLARRRVRVNELLVRSSHFDAPKLRAEGLVGLI